MRTVHVVIVDQEKLDIDFWMHRPTAERLRDEAKAAGHLVYFFTVLVETVIGLEDRLMLAAENWNLFDGSSEPIQLHPLTS